MLRCVICSHCRNSTLPPLLPREEVNTLKDDLEQRDTDSQSQAKIFLKEQQRRINAEKVLKRAAQGLETVLAVSLGISKHVGRGNEEMGRLSLIIWFYSSEEFKLEGIC